MCFAASENYFFDITDSASIRQSLTEDWFIAKLEYLRGKQAEIVTDSVGNKFQVRYEEYSTECAIIVTPEVEEEVHIFTDSGEFIQTRSVYPQGAKGTWILYRNLKDGKPTCVRYHYSVDSGVFVQFRTSSSVTDKKSLADFVILGQYAAKNISVGVPLETFYSYSFNDIYRLTQKSLPWFDKRFYSELFDENSNMVSIIRDNLDRIVPTEDAAYDENKNPIYTKDLTYREEPFYDGEPSERPIYLSEAGFLKWIVDGLIRPISGSGLLTEPLKKDTILPNDTSYAYSVNEEYNVYFTLNWIRNIATACTSVFSGHDYEFETSGVEVKSVPFPNSYYETVGYPVSAIEALMYYLGATEPGRFYLGAIRHTIKDTTHTGTEVSVYSECAAFFPIFKKDGKFSLIIFENGKELTFEEFAKAHPNDFVNFTRIVSTSQFFPFFTEAEN